jgi:cation:H+ antiporter
MEAAFQIIVGLVLLAVGGEAVVRGAVGAARKLGVSELLIGLTLVGFGTSAPELLTSVNAALAGSPGIAVGNVIGSNIANVLFILGVVAIARPVPVPRAAVTRDGAAMVIATAVLMVVGIVFGAISTMLGGAFVVLLIAYVVQAWLAERRGGPAAELHAAEAAAVDGRALPMWAYFAMAAVGIGLLGFGADFLVEGAITVATALGVSQTTIGLTIVAVGTSLPELVASLAAALRGRSDVAFGNIVGSSIYNILGILGVTALITPIDFPADLAVRDWVALAIATALLVIFAWTGRKIGRGEGVVLLGGYIAYVALLVGGI